MIMNENNAVEGIIKAISISDTRGTKKRNVPQAVCIENFGIEHDAHAGSPVRQISLLADESIEHIRKKMPEIQPGAFAENITTGGIDLLKLKIGTKLKIGNEVVLSVSQIGKECHTPCHIYRTVGDCVMPREGIFAVVEKGGLIKPGDTICIQ